ncbi:MAG: MFS transporter [Pseudomonadota bacterium]
MTYAEVSGLRQHWRLLASASIGVMFSVLVLPYYTLGTLVVPVTEAMGWTRAQFQAAIFFSASLGALTAPLVGWLADRYGARRLALPAMVGLAAGFFLAATVDGELWVLYSAYAVMAVFGAGTIPVTWTKAITDTFEARRGLALGLALSGTGVCGVLMPQYATYLVENYGWRQAYVGIGLAPLLLGLPLVYWGFRPQHRIAASPQVQASGAAHHGLTLASAARTRQFWVLLGSVFLVYMAASGIGPNLYPAITDAGLSAAHAASALSAFGGAVVAGRLLVGYLVDKFWAPGVAALTMTLPVVGCWLLIDPQSYAASLTAAILIGLAAGAELDLMSFLVARYFGAQNYATIYSVMYMALAVCSGGAPILFAAVYDRFLSYDLSFSIALILFALGGLLILCMGRYPADSTPRSDGS